MLQRFDEVDENLTARFDDVARRVREVETKMASVEAKVEHSGNQVLELRVEVEQLKNEVCAQGKLIHGLEETVDGVQGRMHRNTLVFNGIPEGTERGGATLQHCKNFMTKFLRDRFNDIPPHLMAIQRTHRSPIMLQLEGLNYRLQDACYRVRVAGYRLRAAGSFMHSGKVKEDKKFRMF